MDVKIIKASFNDMQALHDIQIETFRPLLEKYKDYDTNPGSETMDQVISR